MALALYRKYRPRTFAEVIGQEHVTEPLSQALRSGRLHHAYLFSGPRGCGKTSSARILARSLNCEQGPTPEPCGVCASCKSLANDGAGSIDVIEIDAASHGGVDDARDLREKAFFAPASSRYKIYVIDEAHMVSSAGFNALLKLVEEPPDYVKFIFATTEPEKVLGTIRSRTHHYPFRLIPPAVLRPYLQQLTEAEGVHVDPAVLPLVVRAGGGSARDTLSVLDQLISGAGPEGVSYPRAVSLLGVTDAALIDEMCDALAAVDGAAAYRTIDRVAEAGHDPRRFASDLLERLRDLIVLQQVPDAVTKGLIDGPADQLEQMSAQATRLGPATLSRCADIVHNGLVEMRGTTAPRLLLELITARMLLPGADDASNALLQRLERMERRLTLTADEVRPQPGVAQPGLAQPGVAQPGVASQEAPAVAAPGGGGGISAARAAAAAAGRRAPAGSMGGPGSPVPGSGAGSAGPVPPVRAVPGSVAPVSSAAESSPPAVDEGPPWDVSPAASSVSGPGGSAASAAPASAASASAASVPAASAPADSGSAAPVSAAPGSAAPGSAAPVSAAPASPAPVSAASVPGAPVGHRPEPAGVMPDAPEEPGSAMAAEVPGQLSAAAIREVWPEIMTAVSRKSKKIAALAQGATVRDLEGQTVVLTFRFPAHAKMVAAEPLLISDALYEALGGRWQIRCDVAGEGGGSGGSAPRSPRGGPSGPAQRSPQSQDGPPRESPPQDGPPRQEATRTAPTSGGAPDPQREAAPRGAMAERAVPQHAAAEEAVPPRAVSEPAVQQRAAAERTVQQREAAPRAVAERGAPQRETAVAAESDEWPEPARPGGLATAVAPRAADVEPVDDDEWPETALPGGMSAESRPGEAAGQGLADPSGAQRRPAGNDFTGQPPGGHAPGDQASGGQTSGGHASGGYAPSGQVLGGQALGATSSGATGPGGGAGGATYPPGQSGQSGGHAGTGTTAGSAGDPTRTRPASPDQGTAERSSSRNSAPVAASAPPSAGRAPSSGLAAARAAAAGAGRGLNAAAKASAWSDGSPTEEAPYDPEYDGPPRANGGATRAYEGFDAGDEPLDDVIDEKTARQSSEQQAVQLLRDALGAEKISES